MSIGSKKLSGHSILDVVHLIREAGPDALEIINQKIIEVDKVLTMLYRIRRFLKDDDVCRHQREIEQVAADVARLPVDPESSVEKSVRISRTPSKARTIVAGGLSAGIVDYLRQFGSTARRVVIDHFVEKQYKKNTVELGVYKLRRDGLISKTADDRLELIESSAVKGEAS